MRSRLMLMLMLTLAGVLLASTPLMATPITVDGLLTGDTYAVQVDDVNEDYTAIAPFLGIQDDLDIKAIYLDLDDDWFYLGLETYATPLATDGGANGDWTLFHNVFDTGSGVSVLDVAFNGGSPTVTLDGAILVEGVDYELANDKVLELKISDTLLAPIEFDYTARVDDNGHAADDFVDATVKIPEPTLLALLGVGVPFVARRRRRA